MRFRTKRISLRLLHRAPREIQHMWGRRQLAVGLEERLIRSNQPSNRVADKDRTENQMTIRDREA